MATRPAHLSINRWDAWAAGDGGQALAGRGPLDAFSLYGTPSFGSGHSVTRDMDGDNSLRCHVHAVIDELRPTAHPQLPTVPASIEQVWGGGILHTALFFFN